MVHGSDHPVDRRPVFARGWSVIRQLAIWLARVHISPNAISMAGMLCGMAAGVALGATSIAVRYAWAAWLTAAALILLRATANVLDGLVAVEFGRPSRAGILYNEVPDRVSDAAMLIGLGYAAGGNPVLGYAAACAALFVAYVRAVGKIAGAHQEYGGLMAKQQRMLVVVVVALYSGLASFGSPPGGTSFPTVKLATLALGVIFAGCLWTILWRLRRIASALGKSAP